MEKTLLEGGGRSVLTRLSKLHPTFTPTILANHMSKCLGRPDPRPGERIKKTRVQELEDIPELSTQLVAAQEQFQRVNQPLEDLKNEASAIRVMAMERRQLGTALLAIDKEARLIETQVKIAAEMRAQEMHNEILQKKEWARTQQYIWRFMDKHDLTDEFWNGLNALRSS